MNIDFNKILPHRFPMVLIDSILESSAHHLIAGVSIHKKSLGFENGAVPGWFGVEYMAQAVAAFNGLESREAGAAEPEIGFLVGVRNYSAELEKFSEGEELKIKITPVFMHENSGSFHCEIFLSNKSVAEATITTYKPPADFFKKTNEGGLK